MEKIKKKTKKTFIIFLAGFVIGVVGFTISFIMYLKKDPDIVKKDDKTPTEVNVGDIIFSSIDSSIYLDKAIPTLDKFGILGEPFNFTIKNNSREAKNYTLKLVDDNSTIQNKEIRYELTRNGKVLGIYTLADDGVLDISQIKSLEEIKYSIKIWLDYNSEVKVGTFNKKISVIIDDNRNNADIVNEPILTDGMIPVIYDNNTSSWIITENKNTYSNEWYNYNEKKWANAITVNEEKREEYLNSPIGTKIDPDDINSYWVWIPRFIYTGDANNINVSFVNTNQEAYEAFTFNGNSLEGFWISKFESGIKEDSKCYKTILPSECNNSDNLLYFVPNYPFNNRITMANMFYAIRKMELKNNIYGFKSNATKVNNDGTIQGDNNNIDIHMIKNTEWQAVTLLAYSKYGINDKMINNNTPITGGASINENNYDYNVVDKGVKASTTGTVYGVYDMSGGRREFVMIDNDKLDIFNKKSNSGFTTKIKEYYYDNDFLSDTTLQLQDRYSNDNSITNDPITRGGYKNTGNIFNVYSANDFINKISMESNSRASLIIIREKDYDKA